MKILDWDVESQRAEIAERCATLEARSGRPLSLVVGTSINALGVVRSLHTAGLPSVWLTSNRHSFVNATRCASIVIACSDVFGHDLLGNLEGLGAAFRQRPVLFLTHDFQVKLVSGSRPRLSSRYRFAFPTHERVERMLSKADFRLDAERAGLLLPESYVVRDAAELEKLLADRAHRGGWIAKPLEKSDEFEAQFGKATILRGRPSWSGFVEKYRGVSTPVQLEAMIEGPDSNVVFCLAVYGERGSPISLWCGRKIRQFPPLVGSTACAEPLADDALRAESAKYFEHCEMRGMGSIEFKYGAEDRRLYAIEPTVGRTDLQSEVAVVNGCNLPAMHYHDLTGDPAGLRSVLERARKSTAQRRVWMRAGADWRAVRSGSRSRSAALREWLRAFRGPMSFAVFRWGDPIPFLRLMMQDVRGGMIKTAKLIVVFGPVMRAYKWWRKADRGTALHDDRDRPKTRAD